jgi:cytochrome c peroxidase
VVTRLRKDLSYVRQFEDTFGTQPTQDTVGRALATYLRTLLAGNSVYDRAKQEQAARKGPTLEALHFRTVLKPADLEGLGRKGESVESVASELQHGYQLFFNLGDRKANCVLCHGGANFTDNGFHNLGVGEVAEPRTGEHLGRFAHVPLGEKRRELVGAYKTPTLRGLLGTEPYLHVGQLETLTEVIAFHTEDEFVNKSVRADSFLDPLLCDPKNPSRRRNLELKEDEIKALVQFLRALNGTDVDRAVAAPLPRPR